MDNVWDELERSLRSSFSEVDNVNLMRVLNRGRALEAEVVRLREALKHECWCEGIMLCDPCQALKGQEDVQDG